MGVLKLSLISANRIYSLLIISFFQVKFLQTILKSQSRWINSKIKIFESIIKWFEMQSNWLSFEMRLFTVWLGCYGKTPRRISEMGNATEKKTRSKAFEQSSWEKSFRPVANWSCVWPREKLTFSIICQMKFVCQNSETTNACEKILSQEE